MNQRNFGNICKEAHHHSIYFSRSCALLFSIMNLLPLLLFPSCLENFNCLSHHPHTPRNCDVESCGGGCACTGFAVVNYPNRAEGEGCTHAVLLFCPACSWDVGVCEAGGAWSYSPSTNLIAESNPSLLPSLPPDHS